ncbi:class I SAM-dependent methyltransferase [Alcaligenes faecalis]|uniref:class I SAM-dependent methyltransferase n=1 Tax=Alcaligenes faecalis TaxID=511 RepID=UPI0034D5826D
MMNNTQTPSTLCPSQSAFRVATARALHQLLDQQRILEDPFALGCLGPQKAAELMLDPDQYNDVSGRSLRAGIVVRSKFAEDHLLKAVTLGCRQYVVIGAGLDTWALRTAQSLPAVNVFELDQPAMQVWKRQVYADNGWETPDRLHWISMDLRNVSIDSALRQGGIDMSVPMVVSALGVFVYLSPIAVEGVIHAMRALPIGSSLVMDYRLSEQCLPPIERTIMQFTEHLMAAGGEPWCSSSTPEEIKALLEAAGFDVEEDLGPTELNNRYLARRRDGLQIAGGGFRYLSAIKTR